MRTTSRPGIKRLNADVPAELHRAARRAAEDQGLTLERFVRVMLEQNKGVRRHLAPAQTSPSS